MTEPSGETVPEAPEDTTPAAPAGEPAEDGAAATAAGTPAEPAGADGDGDGEDGDGGDGTVAGETDGDGPETATEASEGSGGAEASGDGDSGDGDSGGAGELSEAQAELAAQRELRAKIEARKAGKAGPVASGAKLSGTAAELLAAVRAVESGSASGGAFYEAAPEPPPRRPEVTVRPPAPAAPPAPTAGALAGVREVLARGGAPEALAGRVAAALGEQAAEALTEDPWRLLGVAGVRPEQADGFARALLGAGCGPDDPRRAVALTTWLLEQAAAQGHTALDVEAVRSGLARQGVPDPAQAVEAAVTEGAVLVFQEETPGGEDDEEEGETAEGPAAPVLLGLDRYALAEESLADGLARLARTVEPGTGDGDELERAVAAHGVVLHTGGEAARAEPLALAAAARRRGLRTLVTAHSAERARALTEAGDGAVEVVALGALLSGAAGPGRDEEGRLALDLLVVLDATQLDVEAGAMLVESLPDGCRLVLSGDPEVLGPAGAGAVLTDALASRVLPRVASRRPDPGPLGELVSGIGVGELNQVEAPGKEVVIVPVRDAGEAVHRTVQLVADSVPRAIGVPPERTQVVTVGHGGSAGTRALNAALKQRLNPGPGRFGGFDPGDRAAYAPVPGRTVTGTVLGADAGGLRLRTAEGELVVPKERVESALRHGWALTAHQAVGGRWPAVVVVLPGDAAPGLSRPWVYTAFGRAERHLSVVHGVDQALARAVGEGVAPPRTTRLRELLVGLLATAENGA